MKISAVIIAKNEEKSIAAAIQSVTWADELIVVDSESTDRTREIAESLGAKVIVREWLGFSAQKQFAVDQAANDWIFSLDADESVSDELRREILTIKDSKNSTDGYKIPRLSFYIDRPIRHGGWYPDWQLRLFDRSKGVWKDVLVHESFQMKPGSEIAKLNGDIIHRSVENAAQHHRMIGERYAPLAARQMLADGRRTSIARIVFAGWISFIQTYFIKAGFLDGFPGFCVAYFAGHHAFMKHLILWELQHTVSPAK